VAPEQKKDPSYLGTIYNYWSGSGKQEPAKNKDPIFGDAIFQSGRGHMLVSIFGGLS